MVRVSVSETYDLSTKTGHMSMVGIRTPRMEILRKTFGGLIENYRMYRFHHCDVKLMCAQVLPADPLQVGVTSGKIAPQDMFNPILYKAVSNQSMNTFELRMHGLRFSTNGSSDDDTYFYGQSIDKSDDVTGFETSGDEFSAYYSLLANRKGWKLAHPQAGLHMRNLRPFVYEKLYSAGDDPTATDGQVQMPDGSSSADYIRSIQAYQSSKGADFKTVPVQTLRGRPRPLPALPTTTLLMPNASASMDSAFGGGTLGQSPDFKDMLIYCGLIVMPPAELNVFYYRLQVRWYIDFFGVRPLNDIASLSTSVSNAPVFYGSDYLPISSSKSMGMVDVSDANAQKIMEGI